MIRIVSLCALLFTASPANADLIGWWRFNEGKGTTTADSAGSNPGQLVNSPVWVTGKIGTALSFQTADNDYVLLANTHITTSNDFSITAWIKLGASGTSRMIMTHGDDEGAQDSGFSLYVEPADKLNCNVIVGADSNEEAVSTAAISEAGVWTFVACTKSGTALKTYINGINDGSITLTSATIDYVGNQVDTRIGARSAAGTQYPFEGEIDDVRLYDHALTQLEINALYATRRPIAPVFSP